MISLFQRVEHPETYPAGSQYRGNLPAGGVAAFIDERAPCFYCDRTAVLLCTDHGARLCGQQDCSRMHMEDVTQIRKLPLCRDFQAIAALNRKNHREDLRGYALARLAMLLTWALVLGIAAAARYAIGAGR